MPQSQRSREAHRGALTRRATAIHQADGPLEEVQATLEFINDRRMILIKLDAQSQQLIEDDDDQEADVEDAADVFMVAEKTVKLCQGKIKELQPQSTSGVATPSSSVLTTKLPKVTLPSFSCEYTLWVTLWDQFTTLVDRKVDMPNVKKL